MTRRKFVTMVGATATAAGPLVRSAYAADPDFTIAVVNDPQYLAPLCPTGYASIMNWIIGNQATVLDGSALNIKAVISGGDCVNTPDSGEAGVAQSAWGILDANGFPWMSSPGNHDMHYDGGNSRVLTSRTLATNFQAGGFFSSCTRANQTYWGSALPGGGGFSYWGGQYDTSGANTYIKLHIGVKKQIYMFLEFNPRVSVLQWAQAIHDANTEYEVIIVTHAFLADIGDQEQRFGGNSPYAANDGPDGYAQGPAPASTSAQEMWSGVTGFAGFTTWARLRMIVNGHFISMPSHTNHAGAFNSWVWQQVPITSTSINTQVVQQIFNNSQQADNTYDYVTNTNGPNPCVPGVESAHLFLLKFLPSVAKLRAYYYCAHTGNWVGAQGLFNSASPVRLFEVDWPEGSLATVPAGTQHCGAVSNGLFPMPCPIGG